MRGVVVEPSDRLPALAVSWTWGFEQRQLDLGSHPSASQPGTFRLLVGVDGREPGSLTRSTGFRRWLSCGATIESKWRSWSFAPTSESNANRVLDVYPFRLAKMSEPGYVEGLLFQLPDPQYDFDANGAPQKTSLLVSTDLSVGDSSFVYTGNKQGMGWALQVTTTKPAFCSSFGRRLYLFLSEAQPYSGAAGYKEAALLPMPTNFALSVGPSVPDKWTAVFNTVYYNMWGGSTGFAAIWLTDWFGIPQAWKGAISTNASPSDVENTGYATTGEYQLAARLMDTERGRLSGWMSRLVRPFSTAEPRDVDRSWRGQSVPAGPKPIGVLAYLPPVIPFASGETTRWLPGLWSLIPWMAPINANSGAGGFFWWDRVQYFSTLSSGAVGQYNAGLLRLVDEFPTMISFRQSAYNAFGQSVIRKFYSLAVPPAYEWTEYTSLLAGAAVLFSNVAKNSSNGGLFSARIETYTPMDIYADIGVPPDDTLYETYTVMNGPESAFAANAAMNPVLDEYFDWVELGSPLASTIFAGLHFLVSRPTIYLNPRDTEPSEDRTVYLMWSDPRGVLLENFPISCVYPLDYTREWEAIQTVSASYSAGKLAEWRAPAIALVPAGGFLYVLGDGPVYQVSRDPTTDVGVRAWSLDLQLPLVSKHSVASFGAGLVVVTATGVFLLDGASGTIRELSELGRIIRRRWKNCHASISVAYDSTMDCCYILNGQTTEMIELWVASGEVTMQERTGFAFARQALLGFGGEPKNRAVFVTPYGQSYYPEERQDSGRTGAWAMHDLTPLGDVTRLCKVSEVYTYTARHGAARHELRLVHPDTGVPVPVKSGSAEPGAQTVIEFTTGPLAGQSYLTMVAPTGAQNHSVFTRLPATTGIVGSLVWWSPIKTYAMCSPPPGRTARATLERTTLFGGIAGIVDLRGMLPSNAAAPLVQLGCCDGSALTSAENIPANATGRGPDQGAAMSGWLNFLDSSIKLRASPPAGVTYDVERPYLQYVAFEGQHGISGAALFPLLLCSGGGWNFDLPWLGIEGKIYPAEKAR
jgi:hypothetical protein